MLLVCEVGNLSTYIKILSFTKVHTLIHKINPTIKRCYVFQYSFRQFQGMGLFTQDVRQKWGSGHAFPPPLSEIPIQHTQYQCLGVLKGGKLLNITCFILNNLLSLFTLLNYENIIIFRLFGSTSSPQSAISL